MTDEPTRYPIRIYSCRTKDIILRSSPMYYVLHLSRTISTMLWAASSPHHSSPLPISRSCRHWLSFLSLGSAIQHFLFSRLPFVPSLLSFICKFLLSLPSGVCRWIYNIYRWILYFLSQPIHLWNLTMAHSTSSSSSGPAIEEKSGAKVETVHTNERILGQNAYYEKDGLRTYGDDADHEHEPPVSCFTSNVWGRDWRSPVLDEFQETNVSDRHGISMDGLTNSSIYIRRNSSHNLWRYWWRWSVDLVCTSNWYAWWCWDISAHVR